MKSCFISAPSGIDTGALESVLVDEGFEPERSYSKIAPGMTFQDSLTSAVGRADLVITVLTEGSSDANVFFETGIAVAKQRRILVLKDLGAKVPFELVSLPTVSVRLASETSVKFAIENFLAANFKKKSKKSKATATHPLSERATELLHKVTDAGVRATEVELENVVYEALRESGVEVLSQPNAQDRRYDFAIWLNELEGLLGNPVLVEVKKRLTKATAKSIARRFLENSSEPTGRALLVVYLEGPSGLSFEESTPIPLIIFVPVSQLLSQLEHQSLGTFVWQQRNRLVHGVP